MKNEKLIPVCIYRDSTGLFSEEECFNDNLIDMLFPEWIVEEWYKRYETEFIIQCKTEVNEKPCFKTWYTEVYTADDTDGLYDFAVEKGFQPILT